MRPRGGLKYLNFKGARGQDVHVRLRGKQGGQEVRIAGIYLEATVSPKS